MSPKSIATPEIAKEREILSDSELAALTEGGLLGLCAALWQAKNPALKFEVLLETLSLDRVTFTRACCNRTYIGHDRWVRLVREGGGSLYNRWLEVRQ